MHSAEPGTNPQIYAVSSNGQFFFPSRFSAGEHYNALLAVQPEGQTCAVTSGVGEIQGEVTNVLVDCVDNEYTVSVTVSGIAADGSAFVGLTSGADVITTSENGYYTFPSMFGYGSEYFVVAPPIEGYSCTFQNHYGRVTGDVTDVELNCVELVGTSFSVSIVFYQIRDCIEGNGVQMSEFKIYDVNGAEIPIATQLTSSPMANPDHGSENLENLVDDNVLTKWLDYTMGTCGNTLTVDGIRVDDEPHFFNFATANDEPNRDPREFQVNICNVVGTTAVSCKSLYYLLEDVPQSRNVFQSPIFSMEAYPVTVIVNGNLGPAVVYNQDNFNDDALTFNTPGTKTFLFEVNQGSTYDVTIASNPPNQMCVTSGVASGTMTGAITVSIFCSEACDVPAFLDELEAAGLDPSLSEGLCITNDRYFWNGQDLCIGAVEESRAGEECPYNSVVCGGPLSTSYGTFDFQVELLLEAFDTEEGCLADYENCDPVTNNECCNPYSSCLYTFDATHVSATNSGFSSQCIPCMECYDFINDCDTECAGVDTSEEMRHPRCPPAFCESMEDDVYENRIFRDEISYCLSGTMIYQNGMMTCVDISENATRAEQNAELAYNWHFDYEFGTDECSDNEKSPKLLVQDHLYISNKTLFTYTSMTDYALENCCLAGNEEVRGHTEDWDEQIGYINDQIGVYSANITAQIAVIVGKLNALQSLLSSV